VSEAVPHRDGARRPDPAALVIAALILILAAGVAYDAATLRAGVAAYSRVGPQVFPYGIAGCLAALGVATAISAFRGPIETRGEPIALSPVLLIAGGLLGQIVLLNFAGFSIATGVVFAATAAALGRPRIYVTYPVGVIFALVVWLVFAMVLKLVLPAGPLEEFARTQIGTLVEFVRSWFAAS
jgi:putative tricarboxylic transport membrane protein